MSSCPNPHLRWDQVLIYIRLVRVFICFLLLISLFLHFTLLTHSSNISFSFLLALVYLLCFFLFFSSELFFQLLSLFPYFCSGTSSPSFFHQYFLSPVFLNFLSNPSTSFSFFEVIFSYFFQSFTTLFYTTTLTTMSPNHLLYK